MTKSVQKNIYLNEIFNIVLFVTCLTGEEYSQFQEENL